jgi:hypothetical protein
VSAAGIYRFSRPSRGYTPVAHQFARCRELKPRAVKVGLYILTHTDGFVQTQTRIAHVLGMDETTVRAALRDLEELRFMVRHDVRDERGHRTGTAYAVTDVPFTDEELLQLSPPGKCPPGKTPGRKNPGPKETTPARETISPGDQSPPGGAAVAEPEPAEDRHEEDQVPKTEQPLALFDAPPVPKSEPERRGEKSAKDIVAAYVDSYRRHIGGDPLKAHLGRVARDAKQMLITGQATFEELETAAGQLGNTAFANIGTQVNILRRTRKPDITRGSCPPVPKEDPRWAAQRAAEQAAMAAELAADPELAADLAAMRAKYTQGAA